MLWLGNSVKFWNKIVSSFYLHFVDCLHSIVHNYYLRAWKKCGKSTLSKIEIAQYERQNYELLPQTIIGELNINEEGIYNLDFLKNGSTTGAYFGGKSPAPHNMCYLIKFIY